MNKFYVQCHHGNTGGRTWGEAWLSDYVDEDDSTTNFYEFDTLQEANNKIDELNEYYDGSDYQNT